MKSIGKEFLKKYQRQLENAVDEIPNADLGEFVSKFLITLHKKEFGRQIHIVCGLVQMLLEIGEREGKEIAIDSLRALILKHGSGMS